jgi:hypothetical protein
LDSSDIVGPSKPVSQRNVARTESSKGRPKGGLFCPGGVPRPNDTVPPCSRTHLIGSRQCRRTADLVELQAVERGSANWKKVLGALKAGQWTWAKVPQGKNCHVDLRGKYVDGQSADASNVDVCADKEVNLTN